MSTGFLGLDVGTGSARAGVFNSAGRLLGAAKRPIAIWREAGGVVEQSSADIWRAVTEAAREAVEASGAPAGAISGLGFAATCSLLALDERLEPLSVNPAGAPERDVMVWMDHRASEDAARINAAGHEVLRYAGGALSPEMQTPKLVWLARSKPEILARSAHFLALTDWLSFRATGSLTRSLCTVTCKFGYLAHERRWPSDFLDSVGLSVLSAGGFARLGAAIVAPGTPLAEGLTAEAARAMGLRPGTPVGAGLIDAHAGALGTLGARSDRVAGDPRRRMALILGTSSSCMAVSDEPRFIDAVWGPHFSALTPGQWLMDGGQSAFGATLDRLRRLHPASAHAPEGGTRRAGEKGRRARRRTLRSRVHRGRSPRAAVVPRTAGAFRGRCGARRNRRTRSARGRGEPRGAPRRRPLRPRLRDRRHCRGVRARRIRLRRHRGQRRSGAKRPCPPDRRRRLPEGRVCAGHLRTRPAGLGDDRRRRGGKGKLALGDGVDVGARSDRGTGERPGRRASRPQAPRPRDSRTGGARGPQGDTGAALARSRHFRLRRRAGGQRADLAQRHPANARRGRPEAQRRRDAPAVPGPAPGRRAEAHRSRTRRPVAQAISAPPFRARSSRPSSRN